VHANNLLVDPRYTGGHPVGIDSAPSYRRDRIAQLIDQAPKHDPADFQKIQTDVELPRAARLVPALLADLKDAKLDATGTAARDLLAHWDFNAPKGSAAAAVFFETYRLAIVDALADKLPPSARTFFLAERYSTNVADGWFDRQDNPVWDDRRTPEVETRQSVVRRAFCEAVAQLRKAQGDDALAWRWGALHKYQPKHAFGGKSALAGTVNLEEMEDAGGLDSVLKSHFDLGNDKAPFRTMAGPVYRMVVDLGDLAHARWVIDTGSSGWPHTPHYGDQYQAWKKGELLPMLFDDAEVRAQAAGIETLEPR